MAVVTSGFPHLPSSVPQVHSRWRRLLGIGLMRLSGWRIENNFPDVKKFVLIVAPHTSNWDFFHGACAYFALQLQTTWLVKESALKGPIGALARYFGAAGIDRSQASNIVHAYIAEFLKREAMILTITPEGTRKKVPEWKSGFYRVAVAAKVPIVPVAFDFPRKRVVVNPPFYPNDDLDADLPKIKAHFNAQMARHPELF
jgi:1-acyl-sn-glycerol-3-phosphate acyltransferase